MARIPRLLALPLTLLALASPAAASRFEWPPPPKLHYTALDQLASGIAKRDVTVRCPTEAEADEDGVLVSGAWGYVWFENGEPAIDYSVVKPYICADALDVADGRVENEWNAALAVLVITHESYHLRIIKHNEHEAVTECRAIKRFTRSVEELSGSHELGQSLLGEALAIHQWWLPAQYHLKTCDLPIPEPRS